LQLFGRMRKTQAILADGVNVHLHHATSMIFEACARVLAV
jgi:hypothetical protein